MKTLLLVDGSSYLYRAFHALPDLRNRVGEPTGALYGVVNMLQAAAATKGRRIISPAFSTQKARPSATTGTRTTRRTARRCRTTSRADRTLHELVRALGWPLLMIDGVEADDVIGTLTTRAVQSGMKASSPPATRTSRNW
jgi:DNA polymerase-1